MLPDAYDGQDCSVARALEVVGERWTLLVVREALLGSATFDEFAQRLGVATNTLSRRLDRLVDAGVLERSVDDADRRRRRYELTESGRELAVVVEALRAWGDRHGGVSPPIEFTHAGCGGIVDLVARCRSCGSDVDLVGDLHRREHRPVRRPQ